MNNKHYRKIRKQATRQGWNVNQTSEGEMFLSPDGVTRVAWHMAHASSDPHALDAFVRQLRKGGYRP